MKKYVDREKLQEFATKLTDKYKTLFSSPLVASAVEDMTDTEKVYVYVGSETGYTSGNWYYYDGSEWVSGGVYNSTAFETDATLTHVGAAADAKATGDNVTEIRNTANGLYSEKTISGSTLMFNDGAKNIPVKELTVQINPIQSGSGDPSPTNIRAITGRTEVNITRYGLESTDNPQVYSIAFPVDPGTVYFGTLNVTTGLLTVTHAKITYNGTESWNTGEAGLFYRASPSDAINRNSAARNSTGLCNQYELFTNITATVFKSKDYGIIYNHSDLSGSARVYIRHKDFATATELRTYLTEHPVELVYRLQTSLTYNLTKVTVTTLLENNTIFADTGDINLTYYVDPKKEILDLIDISVSVPYVTPQMYGAYADNIHDDTTAFQAAINSGKDVFIPTSRNEIYKITDTLTIKRSGQKIYTDSIWRGGGLSSGGWINFDLSESGKTEAEMRTTPLFDVANIQMAHFYGLKFSNTPEQSALFMDASTTLADKDIYVESCMVVYFYRCFNVRGRGFALHNNMIASCLYVGTFNWDDANESNDNNANKYGQRAITIKNNRFHSITRGLFRIETGHAYGLTIQANHMDHGRGYILIANNEAWNWLIEGNVFDSMYKQSEDAQIMFNAGAKYCNLSNNVIASENDYWTKIITVDGQSQKVVDDSKTPVDSFVKCTGAFASCSVSGNVFRSSQYSNLVFETISGTSINGNVFDGAGNKSDSPAAGAISLNGVSERAAIVGNTFIPPAANPNAKFILAASGTKLNNSAVYANAHGTLDGGLTSVKASSTNLKTDET